MAFIRASARGMTQDSMSLMIILGNDLESRRFKSPDSYIRKFGGSKLMRWGPLCSLYAQTCWEVCSTALDILMNIRQQTSIIITTGA